MKRRGAAAALAALLSVVAAAGCSTDDVPYPVYGGTIFRAVLANLELPDNLPVNGDWPADYGDANYFGPAFYYRWARFSGDDADLAVARATREHDKRLMGLALKNLGKLLGDLDYVMMAALGVAESQRFDPDAGTVAQLDKLVDAIEALGKAVDYYPDHLSQGAGADANAIDTYGPTTMNAAIALIQLEYARSVGGAKKAQRQAAGLEALKKGRELAYDKGLGYYRFSSKNSDLYLYPNVLTMISLVRAYQLTKDKSYLDQAEELHGAIQKLKVAGEARYRSPYSAKYMGAKTADYSTLSSHNYTMIALALLYRETGKPRYKQEVLAMLDFARERLLENGRLLHHIIDGRLALPKDPEYYCSGCNLQTLYLILRLDDLL